MTQLMSVLYLFVALTSNAFATETQHETFPINILCSDTNEPKTIIKLGANPLKDVAYLYYQSPNDEHPVVINISRTSGIYSGSSFTITSSFNNEFYGSKMIQLSGSFAEVFRVTHFRDFSLILEQNDAGSYVAKSLSYRAGIDTFPDQLSGNVNFTNLICTIEGL